ncbi:MAG: sigma-70 family RNA polymerase sigma factor [Candidatus Baltobacteraceae bacterium]
MMRALPVRLLLALVLVAGLGGRALADQAYEVAGTDSFSIAGGDITSRVNYRGTESLAAERNGHLTRLSAHARYVRSDQGAQSPAEAEYVEDVAPDGTVVDTADRDPDYLTVLNQPFAAQLDHATLDDLQSLRAPLPFDFPSPFTGSSLHGYLQKLPVGSISGRSAAGVRFEAAGPMRGALPDRPGLTLIGTIAMRGTAFYDRSSALLLALDATVTISGYVSNRTSNDQVTIVYRRTIRAVGGGDRASLRGTVSFREELANLSLAGVFSQEFRVVPRAGTAEGKPAATVAPASSRSAEAVPSTERFERIVDEYQRRLYGFALRMTGNREDAEEIVQDAFVRAFRALGKMSPEQRGELRLQPWLYTITLNVTRNRLRSKRPTNVALDALADPDALLNNTQEGPEQPEQIVERGTDMALVEQALLQLPMHLRAAATLRFIEGRSHPEIAEILNQPIGTVKSHVHRAVRILRRILGPQVGRLASSGETVNAVL